MMERTDQTPTATRSGMLGGGPADLEVENSWRTRLTSSRAETIYQAATVAAALLVLLSV
jgi:hypothetical protein